MLWALLSLTNVLGNLDEGVGHLGGVGTAGLDTDGGNLGAGGVQEGRGALHGVEGGGLAAGDCSSSISYCLFDDCPPSSMAWLTRVGTAELLELDWRAGDLDGALGSHRRHLGRSHAEGRCHCDDFGVFGDGRDGF